jgi:hypothetical protein
MVFIERTFARDGTVESGGNVERYGCISRSCDNRVVDRGDSVEI